MAGASATSAASGSTVVFGKSLAIAAALASRVARVRPVMGDDASAGRGVGIRDASPDATATACDENRLPSAGEGRGSVGEMAAYGVLCHSCVTEGNGGFMETLWGVSECGIRVRWDRVDEVGKAQ